MMSQERPSECELLCSAQSAVSLVSVCLVVLVFFFFFFFKQKTAYEIGTGDWSSDVCSSDLTAIFTSIFTLCVSLPGS